jgi:hypothetical protein
LSAERHKAVSTATSTEGALPHDFPSQHMFHPLRLEVSASELQGLAGLDKGSIFGSTDHGMNCVPKASGLCSSEHQSDISLEIVCSQSHVPRKRCFQQSSNTEYSTIVDLGFHPETTLPGDALQR